MATVILGEALKREFALLRTAVLNFSFQGKRVSFFLPENTINAWKILPLFS